MLAINHTKEYYGGFVSEDDAAREYDWRAISTYGLKAKTNFSYTKRDVLFIIEYPKLMRFEKQVLQS